MHTFKLWEVNCFWRVHQDFWVAGCVYLTLLPVVFLLSYFYLCRSTAVRVWDALRPAPGKGPRGARSHCPAWSTRGWKVSSKLHPLCLWSLRHHTSSWERGPSVNRAHPNGIRLRDPGGLTRCFSLVSFVCKSNDFYTSSVSLKSSHCSLHLVHSVHPFH